MEMDEGTIAAVLIFSQPWPPPMERQLLSRRQQGSQITLAADPLGRLVFSSQSGDQEPRVFRFQPMQIEGGGRAVLILTWSGNEASLWLNGHEVHLDTERPHEVFTVGTSAESIPHGPLLGQLDLRSATTDAEYIFLATLTDIDQKTAEGSRYNLIRAAGLLRQLLMDPTPLVHEVNRKYRRRLEFEVIDPGNEPPLTPQARWQNPDASRFPGATTTRVSLDGLLRTRVLVVEGVRATVRDLIAACAHVKGGVHLGRAQTAQENALIDWDRAFTLLGEEPSLRAVAGLCRVVIVALRPLAQEIVGSSQAEDPLRG